MVSFATILSSGSIWQLGLTTRPGRRRISGSARSWFQAASGHELAQTIDKDSKLLQFRINRRARLGGCNVFVGPSSVQILQSNTEAFLQGQARRGDLPQKLSMVLDPVIEPIVPPIRSRSGHRPVGRAE